MAAVGGGATLVLVENDLLLHRMASYVVSGGTVQLGMMTRHWRVRNVPAGSAVTMGDAVTRLATLMSVTLKSMLNPAANYYGMSLRRILPHPPSQDATDNLNQGLGTGAAGNLTAKQVSGLITIKTGFSGRAYRGRVYPPFPGDGDNTNVAAPSVAYKVKLDSLAVYLKSVAVVTAGGFTVNLVPVLFHRGTETTTDVTDALTRGNWATQRRRGDFGRVNALPW